MEVTTVSERGWSGVTNGELLRLAEVEFDVMLTMDRGIEYQQNLTEVDMAIVFLKAHSNDYDDLLPLVDKINETFKTIKSGEVVRLG